MENGEVFNPQEKTTYFQYLDANNLYGWTVSHRFLQEILSG